MLSKHALSKSEGKTKGFLDHSSSTLNFVKRGEYFFLYMTDKLMKFIDNKWKVISENERLQLTKTEGQVHKNPFCSSLLPFCYTIFSFLFKSGRFRPVWASRVKMLRDNSTTQQLFDLKWY